MNTITILAGVAAFIALWFGGWLSYYYWRDFHE